MPSNNKVCEAPVSRNIVIGEELVKLSSIDTDPCDK